MNFRIVNNYLGKILVFESIFMLPSLIIALFQKETSSVIAFLAAMILQSAVGALMLLLFKPKNKNLYSREGCVIVALSWVFISIFGALPFLISGTVDNYVDALFETVSGFTTTGATILEDIEAAPMSILYWRSFTHWIGGMGVLVFILSLSPLTKGNGMSVHILRAESPGPSVEKIAPKTHLSARILYGIYIVLTVLEIVFLLCGGMPLFDSVTTAFSTAGTGGFSIKNDSMASYSTYCQTVAAVFMVLFGVNFNVYFLLLLGDLKSAFKNSEVRTYLLIIAASVIAITVKTASLFNSIGEAFHHSFFQVASIITTTGFITCDYEIWPEITHEILLALMVIGACAGSTGGGIKVSRLMILIKSLFHEIKKYLHPHSVSVITLDGAVVNNDTLRRCGTYFSTYAFLIMISCLSIAFIDGLSFETNFSAILATINNIGPGLQASGPTESFNCFSALSKIILMINMLIGRLEIFPMLVLFAPETWKMKK